MFVVGFIAITQRANKTHHHNNADHVGIQLHFLHDPRFYESVVEMMGLVETAVIDGEAYKILVILCTGGNQRSQGTAKALAHRVLNAIVFNGHRFYTARVFTCEDCEAHDIEETVIKQARKWMKPWALAEPEAWGSNAAELNSRAAKQVAWMDDLAKIKSGEEPTAGLCSDTLRPLTGVTSSSDDEHGDDDEDEVDDVDVAPSQSKPRPRIVPAPKPRPVTPPPRDRITSAAAERDDEATRYWKHRRIEAARRPRTASHGGSRGSASDTGVSGTGWDWYPCCDGKGWVQVRADGTVGICDTDDSWCAVLAARGCDDTALANWAALFHSYDGHDEALKLVHQVMKKESGGYAVGNVSGFITRAVRTAWCRIAD